MKRFLFVPGDGLTWTGGSLVGDYVFEALDFTQIK